MIKVAAAGPISNIFLAFVGIFTIYTLFYINPSLLNVSLKIFLQIFIQINIYLAIFNLIPMYPLDGGQILWHALGPTQKSLTLRISMFTAVVVGLFLFLWLKEILFPIILGFMAYQNYKMLIEPTPRRPW
jgi:Zn-dependent protease